jgi:hypothetical protein
MRDLLPRRLRNPRKNILRHCEERSDEAIQSCAGGKADCFVAVLPAMTKGTEDQRDADAARPSAALANPPAARYSGPMNRAIPTEEQRQRIARLLGYVRTLSIRHSGNWSRTDVYDREKLKA